MTRWGAIAGAAGAGAALYLGVVTGRVTVDLEVGRRRRMLGPRHVVIDAERETVFDVIAEPYLRTTPHAMSDKLRVIERGSDTVLAEHRTALSHSPAAVTLETVRFSRPTRIDFRLVRGPVPFVVESFDLGGEEGTTLLRYSGELGTDGWALGALWGQVVARRWVAAVDASLESIKAEAERRAASRRRRHTPGHPRRDAAP